MSTNTATRSAERLPIGALLALAMAAFITLLTEIMPAGLLSSIAQGLSVSESLAGQFITAYAVGALVAAIPVTTLTQGMRRRPLLLTAIAGFAMVNLVTALSDSYAVSLAARFFAGVFGGIVWSLLAGYAVRLSPPHLSGRAIAISGAGATIALVLGVPLGAWLGRAIGWQDAFGLMTVLALVLMAWIVAIVPDFPGQAKAKRQALPSVFLKFGIRAVLFVVFTFVVAHNILYIYIEPFLATSGLSAHVDVVLFTFGAGSIIGLWFVGALVDRRLQWLAVASITFFAFASLLLGLWGDIPQVVYPSVLVWGFAFGGFATITQTALSRCAGESVDVAQSMYTTGWNTAVACGGVIGGFLLGRTGATSFAWIVITVLAFSLLGTVFAMNRALTSKT
ncbi:MFS transporter [Pseudomonas carnis]|uniref:MFS transporter n=1 Tax=Pseudomonas carnis TaxID=2487355 RepID=UPI001DBA8D37|nr:MFS transporter [Pseudomonas carnis]CAH0241597.1 Purine ribonucleoside efflux pump NepI [Pseudomonas carnis]CAH0287086.1 Purine ribonucleoside efflux pump NepI [Pseudomonas carnis]CAH0309652.1 Purine ribonucleoside efflux pump NepI [Pseudomonas carnis]CAH0316165.1 Purine ribonucleoside efflux pump NepI [Pseudomonas carnis]